ncbi:hypothetical protein AB0D10_39835 [Kitasatospora sp. NPDC048545]|uniref:hypothetical protein n=1 Tax=Kitasatospora sp. NPDC048545 TaxID=3157208 RepID=UPI0033C6BE42
MFKRLRNAVTDTAVELKGHAEFTRDIKAQAAAGDREAAGTFRTGTLAAALTSRGRNARGREVVDYVQQVIDTDGSATRVGWLHRR